MRARVLAIVIDYFDNVLKTRTLSHLRTCAEFLQLIVVVMNMLVCAPLEQIISEQVDGGWASERLDKAHILFLNCCAYTEP